jgi:hypothetical protein
MAPESTDRPQAGDEQLDGEAFDAGAGTDRGSYPVRGVPSDNTTLVSVLGELEEHGFTSQLIPNPDASIECGACNQSAPAVEFAVEAVRRLEGASDPDDMMIVIGARCPRCAEAGTLVLGYGPNASEDDVAISRAFGGLSTLVAHADSPEPDGARTDPTTTEEST